jgi:glycerophosphoryl diester phosphodiesterase
VGAELGGRLVDRLVAPHSRQGDLGMNAAVGNCRFAIAPPPGPTGVAYPAVRKVGPLSNDPSEFVMALPRRSFLATLLALLTYSVAWAGEPPRPLVVGHRGLFHHAPENTLAGFRACLELRLGFEFDVERTKDGHLICIHDGSVDRTTTGKGKLSEMTLEQVRRLDAGSRFDPKFAGERVPTVEEVLKLVAEYKQHEVLIAVDLKAAGVEGEVVRLAEKYQVLHRLLFIGRTISEPKVRERIKRASPKAQTAALANDAEEFPSALAASDADWVYLRFLPTREQMADVTSKGKRAFIAGKTVAGDLPANWRKAAGVGIDGILTDHPIELGTLLREKREK